MKKRLRKVLAMVLTATMAFTIATPVFAGENNERVSDARCEEIIVEVNTTYGTNLVYYDLEERQAKLREVGADISIAEVAMTEDEFRASAIEMAMMVTESNRMIQEKSRKVIDTTEDNNSVMPRVSPDGRSTVTKNGSFLRVTATIPWYYLSANDIRLMKLEDPYTSATATLLEGNTQEYTWWRHISCDSYLADGQRTLIVEPYGYCDDLGSGIGSNTVMKDYVEFYRTEV